MAKIRKVVPTNGSIEKKVAQSVITRLGEINEQIRALEKEKEELREELAKAWETLVSHDELERDSKGNYELYNSDGWKCTAVSVTRRYASKEIAEKLLTEDQIDSIWVPKTTTNYNIKKQ